MSEDTPEPKAPPSLLERPLAIATALLTLIGMTVGGGFWAGLHYSESKALADKSELVAQHTQAVADLKICGANLDAEKSKVTAATSICTNTQAALAEKDQKILALTSVLERQSNCAFIHEQIRTIQAEIEYPTIRSVMAYSSDMTKQDEETKARHAALEQRIAEYQKQLGTCNR